MRNCEWKTVLKNGDGMNRNDRQLINEVYKQIIEVGLSKLKEGMEKKVTLA